MKPSISIKQIGKKYSLGLTQEDMLANKVLSSAKKAFSNKFRGKQNNENIKDFWALRDISFDVLPGEVVGIIGRNGAGKTTLLKILSKITSPTEGEIRLRGRVASLLEVGTGFHAELTGRENVHLNGSILGMHSSEIRKKFDEIVAFSEVEKFIDTPVKRYSSGMYVRLAFAVAAHLEPEILIVDEVLAVGDSQFQKKCLGKMDSVSKEGRTVLFVSHNMGVLGKLCQTAVQLEKGRLVSQGICSEVINDYLDNQQEAQDAEISFEADTIRDMTIKKIQVLDSEGNPSIMLDRSKPFFINVEYDIEKKTNTSHVLCVLSTIDGVHRMCQSSDIDDHLSNMAVREPGTYCSKVEFPGGILNVGNYRANIALKQSKKTVVDVKMSPTFELVDTGDIGDYQTSLPSHKRALLALKLNWTVKKTGEFI